jgi:restriction endonuclease Mrr
MARLSKIDNQIMLIDGKELRKLKIENNLGVSTNASHKIKRMFTFLRNIEAQ